MKRRLINILFSVLSVGLAFGLFFFSVYAITSTTSINNIFYFQVSEEDLHVGITGDILNYVADVEIQQYYHNPDNTDPENFVRWNLPDLFFAEENGQIQDMIFVFTIENHEQFRSIRVYFTDYITTPVSTKILNTPSDTNGILIAPMIFDGVNYTPRVGVIQMRVSVIDTSESFSKINNSFTLNFEALNL